VVQWRPFCPFSPTVWHRIYWIYSIQKM